MTVYVSMLRGINLGEHNKISMKDLVALYVDQGYSDVTPYLQSGNVIFRTGATNHRDLVTAIERRIERDLGVTVTVVLRTSDDIGRVVKENPFLPEGADPTKLHVTFFAESPGRTRVRDLEVPDAEPDEYRIQPTEVYLHCPQGYGRTKLNNAFWERRLGVAATTRNWKTVTSVYGLASA